MNEDAKNYEALHHISREAQLCKGIVHLLEWDKETYMPAGASKVRAEHLELMASIVHQKFTGPVFKSALGKLIDLDTGTLIANDLSNAQKTAVVEWHRQFARDVKLPEKFVKKFTKLTAEATHDWAVARKNNDFKSFAPTLDRIINMCKERAELLGYQNHPYDALLDEFEPHAQTSEVAQIFQNLKPSIVQLLKQIKSVKQIDNHFLQEKVSHEDQMHFVKELVQEIGYDFNHGRIDLSAHPFSASLHPHDSRITTRVRSDAFFDNISACLHEFGHSLYEMSLPEKYYGSPLGEYASLGIHESQSRWWETRIGQSKSFWSYFLPKLQKSLNSTWQNISLDRFYKAINLVEPSFIRVEADEVTYTLHVILRFELECDLITGSLDAKDLPEAWNAKMKDYLDITPPSDTLGCLQDIHWSMGAFGYFPTYSLGNIYAAHFFTAFEKEYPQWEQQIASGEFTFIRNWLKQHIHQYGRQYSATALANKVAGKPLSSEAYSNYLQKKYHEIYQLS